jgi:enamine deaminase RidA (YjgF/YER057c/UK114 family)
VNIKRQTANGKRQKCTATALLFLLLLTVTASAQPRVPRLVDAETARLRFQVSDVPQAGTVAEQVRQCLRGFSSPVVALRAFVVGQENAATVRDAVEAEFKKRRQPLPALSIIIVGALPHQNARVQIEAVTTAKQSVNPNGIAFVSGQPASAEQPAAQVAPLIEKSLSALRTAHQAINIQPADVLRGTCFVSSLGDVAEVKQMMRREFPQAALGVIQIQRTASRALVECETVARLRMPAKDGLQFINPEGLAASPNYSHLALISARRLFFSELVVAVSAREADAVYAFARLEQALTGAGSSIKQVAMSQLYPITQAGSELVRKVRFDFYDKAHPPASTLLIFEGLPIASASFAVAVIAVKPE